jgi:hypothetical protein
MLRTQVLAFRRDDLMPATERPEEDWTRKILAAELAGAIVTRYDDRPSPGMYDLAITYPDGRTGAAEVTAAAHREAIALWRLISAQRWIEKTLRGGWAVSLTPTANYKRLKTELPRLLLQLESNRVSNLKAALDRSTKELAAELGILSAYQGDTAYPRSIYPTIDLPLDQTGGFVSDTGDPLATWLADWIRDPRRADNVRKLGSSGANERHLVVIVAGFGNVPFHVTDVLTRDYAPLPTIPLSLPAEITNVWTMSTWSRGHGIRWTSSGKSETGV